MEDRRTDMMVAEWRQFNCLCRYARSVDSCKPQKSYIKRERNPEIICIGADSTGTTGNFAPVLTQEPGQTLRFAPVPFMAVL